MQNALQILKFNEARSGTKDGRNWEMQDAECILFDADGNVGEVGVLQLPRELIAKRKEGKLPEGRYTGHFALQADKSREGQRRIKAILTNLVPMPPVAPQKDHK